MNDSTSSPFIQSANSNVDSAYTFHYQVFSFFTILFGVGISFDIIFLNSLVGYNHAFFLNVIMFLAELSCLPLYYLLRAKNIIQKETQYHEITHIECKNAPKKMFLIPAIVDCLASMTVYLGTAFAGAEFIIIQKVCQIITTLIVSRIMNSHIRANRLKNDHIIGMVLTFIGQTLFGLSFLITDQMLVTGIAALGMSLITCSLYSIKHSIEQNLFFKYYIHPMKAVGLEGLMGSILSICMFVGASFIPCRDNFLAKICPANEQYLENIVKSFTDLNIGVICILLVVGHFILALGKNYFDMFIGKIGTPYNRVIIDSIRVIPIFFSIISISTIFSWISSIVGSLMILFGVLVFLLVIKNLKKKCGNSTDEDDKEKASSLGIGSKSLIDSLIEGSVIKDSIIHDGGYLYKIQKSTSQSTDIRRSDDFSYRNNINKISTGS